MSYSYVYEELLRSLRNLQIETRSPLTNATALSPQPSTSTASRSSNHNIPECHHGSKPGPSRIKTFTIPKPVKVKKNPNIVIDILKAFGENTPENTKIVKSGKVYLLKELSPLDYEYSVKQMTFESSMSHARKAECKSRKFNTVKKVCCPYLVAHFEIRKEKTRRLEGYVYEQEVYHGTTNANVNSICKENFDWRKSGTHVGTKFGRGVSFAKYPTYASFYPKIREFPRSMLVTKIVYVRKQIGRSGMTVPDGNYDTTTNAKEEVIVKYDDAEFLPLFVIHYS